MQAGNHKNLDVLCYDKAPWWMTCEAKHLSAWYFQVTVPHTPDM